METLGEYRNRDTAFTYGGVTDGSGVVTGVGCRGALCAETRLLKGNIPVASGRLRLTRSKLLAKRPHSGGHWLGKKLNNAEEDLRKTSGRPREDLLP